MLTLDVFQNMYILERNYNVNGGATRIFFIFKRKIAIQIKWHLNISFWSKFCFFYNVMGRLKNWMVILLKTSRKTIKRHFTFQYKYSAPNDLYVHNFIEASCVWKVQGWLYKCCFKIIFFLFLHYGKFWDRTFDISFLFFSTH